MRRVAIPLLTALVSAISLAACSSLTDATGPVSANRLKGCATAPDTCNSGARKPGGEITWVLEQGWGDQWNPMRPEGATNYAVQAYAGIQPVTGTFLPSGKWAWNMDLYASPPQLIKTDPQTMRYVLRPQAVWSDGVPISGDDFVFNWFHNSGRADQCAGCDPYDTTGWAHVASVQTSGQTVTITYQAGVHDPEWFAHFGPAPTPAHIATKAGIDWHTPKGMGAASVYFRDTVPTWSGGPYVIQSVAPDQRVIMVPNPKWYGRTKPTLAKIVKEVLPNQSEWPAAIANGEIDGGAPLSFNPDIAQQLRSTSGISTAVGTVGANWEHVDLNLTSPALKDVALRKAIFTALDVTDLRKRLYGSVTPTLRTNPLFPQQSPYYQNVIAGTGYGSGDLRAARKLLAAAGYSGTQPGQHLSRNGKAVPALRWVYIIGNPTRQTFVEIAQSELAQIGVTITPVGIVGSNYITTLSAGRYDLSIHAWDGGPLFTQFAAQFYRTGAPLNLVGLSDPVIDRASDEILDQTDIKAAAVLANKIAKQAMADAFSLPLWENPTYVFVRNDYVNVRDDPMAFPRAEYDIEAWGLAAGK